MCSFAAQNYDGWTVVCDEKTGTWTKKAVEKCVEPVFDGLQSGVEAVFQRIQQGFNPISDGNLSIDNSMVSSLSEDIQVNVTGTNG